MSSPSKPYTLNLSVLITTINEYTHHQHNFITTAPTINVGKFMLTNLNCSKHKHNLVILYITFAINFAVDFFQCSTHKLDRQRPTWPKSNRCLVPSIPRPLLLNTSVHSRPQPLNPRKHPAPHPDCLLLFHIPVGPLFLDIVDVANLSRPHPNRHRPPAVPPSDVTFHLQQSQTPSALPKPN